MSLDHKPNGQNTTVLGGILRTVDKKIRNKSKTIQNLMLNRVTFCQNPLCFPLSEQKVQIRMERQNG